MPARPQRLATVRLAHGNDLANATTLQVGRPRTGSRSHAMTCATCGTEFMVDILSLETLQTQVRRTRIVQGAVGLGVGVVLLVVAVSTTSLMPLPVIAAILGGLVVIVALAHLAITPYYLGYTLRRAPASGSAGDGPAQPLPGVSGHRVF